MRTSILLGLLLLSGCPTTSQHAWCHQFCRDGCASYDGTTTKFVPGEIVCRCIYVPLLECPVSEPEISPLPECPSTNLLPEATHEPPTKEGS